MTFQPGNPGRPKGSRNKDTQTVRDIVEGILGRSIPEEMLALAKTPALRLKVMDSLLPYAYRKLAPKEDAETIEARTRSDAALVANAVNLLQTRVRENSPDDTER